jgi:hypothetical protein
VPAEGGIEKTGMFLAKGVNPLSAHAATLTITSLSCEVSLSSLLCDGWVSGGTPAYTYT